MCPRYPIFFILFVLVLIINVHRSGSDCLADDVVIRDGNKTMISPGGIFELGFFTPDGSLDKSRYLGIWYNGSNPKIVVWVANRDNPLLVSNGCLAIRDGHAVLLDVGGTIYWSTNAATTRRRKLGSSHSGSSGLNFPKLGSHSNNSANLSTALGSLQLTDCGNLNFNNRKGSQWQSFDHPSDTFLPGMGDTCLPGMGDTCLPGMSKYLNLTSWQTHNNPAAGNFTLQLQQALLSIYNRGSIYWKNEDTGLDEMPPDLSDLLLGRSSQLVMNGSSRLVMNFTGQVQFWKWEAKQGWLLIWSEPKDRCSLYNTCGDFGSCNSDNRQLCKCLPGFEPNAQDKWNTGHFSDGCLSKSESCKRNVSDEMFLRLPMMKVVAQNHNGSTANQDCKTKCVEECHCVAYSCGGADCKETAASDGCWMWKSMDLTNLQEEYSGGITIFVRTHSSDIALTSKSCTPCGTNIIPYPLSTAPNCGDPSYFNFSCNASTGQVGFSTSKGTFKVTAISPEAKTFTIQSRHARNCDTESLLSPNHSSSFNVINCSSVTQSLADVEQSFIEVEMAWKPPLEPACSAPKDCLGWPHTTCKAARHGNLRRCICGSKFRWCGKNLKCVRVQFRLKVVIACISGALAVALLCGIPFIHHVWKRRLAPDQGSVEFLGDDTVTGGIDVPFFDWGSIIAATDNFAEVNKLGAGGFGAVYKGKLPDGKEIAVKRLSTVTEQGVEEFRTEVVLIAKLQHRNLVRLVGYCAKADERILLYEYMPNGSLDSCLFDQTRSVFLDWVKRFDIVFGIARGLLYLHQDSRLRIIHRDLKPSNILLDEEMNPKISDFGIARIVGGKETEGSTKRVVGTYGYMSPEYAYEGLFSVKSDVFSFGVVVLETISGRRNSKLFQLEHGVNLQGYAWNLWNEDRGWDLMDQTLKESCKPSEVLKCIHIGLLCVQEDPTDRPTMSSVVLMLGSENASLPPPKQPAFISRKEPSETASSSSAMESGLHDIINFSTEGR